MLKSVFFDMDGVLVNSHPIHIRAWKRLLASLGITPAEEELEMVRDGKKKDEILRYFLGDLTQDQIRLYGQEKDRLYREEEQDLEMMEGIEGLLEELSRADIPAAVVSSGSCWRVNQTLDSLKLRGHFTAVVTGDEFEAGKSDSTIFRKAAQQMTVRCQDSLVFEDSVSAVRSATAIGMKCLGIGDCIRAKALLEAGAERVYSNFLHTNLSELQQLFAASFEHTSICFSH